MRSTSTKFSVVLVRISLNFIISSQATAASPPKKGITKQRASKNTGQKTSAQAGRVSKNISKNISKKKGAPKRKRDEEPDDEEQDEDVPKKKGAPKRKRDEEPDDEEQDEDDEEAGQDDESDSELSVSGDSDEESEDGDDADGPIDLEEDDDTGCEKSLGNFSTHKFSGVQMFVSSIQRPARVGGPASLRRSLDSRRRSRRRYGGTRSPSIQTSEFQLRD